uniref:Uncharacterized protein n=1 Tax=Rhizophora mucronata TaxID=61149 RepID=A0A2P2Q2D4_RHIMU
MSGMRMPLCAMSQTPLKV